MELIDTRIGSQAGGVTTVEFIGEGGESVTIKMAAGDVPADRQAALLRARQMMVQLTAFENDAGSASSGGEEAEGGLPEAAGRPEMQHAGDRPTLDTVPGPARP